MNILQKYPLASVLTLGLVLADIGSSLVMAYTAVDTAQTACYDNRNEITCPAKGKAFYGQDAQFNKATSPFLNNNDNTITDTATGLMWQKSPDTNGDGEINAKDKQTYEQALAGAKTFRLNGHDDWHLPTIKELYSLIDFRGADPDPEASDSSNLIPFIDTQYFDFAYGDTKNHERIIDSQYASSNLYVSTTGPQKDRTLFGVNFADGRIKGYGLNFHGGDKTFFVMYVRGNSTYGVNDFVDNTDNTITDKTTGLMWAQDDSAKGMNWQQALAWVQTKNSENYLGHNDWRMPNAKELQNLVDYSRSPDTTNSAAIDPLFHTSTIKNEADQVDYPFYWSSTTHKAATQTPGERAVYVAFGRAMGKMDGVWSDVHGAGSQRSDPKQGDPKDFAAGHGPQSDAIRINNYVRLVRDAAQPEAAQKQ